jgi:hypothetical protein
MNKNSIEVTTQKCTCVPSGRCHPQSRYLLGCPHPHYFNEKNVWTCGIDPASDYNRYSRPTQSFSQFGTTPDLPTRPSHSPSFIIDMNPWGEYVVRKTS